MKGGRSSHESKIMTSWWNALAVVHESRNFVALRSFGDTIIYNDFFSRMTTQFIDNSSILVIDMISEATMRLPISWERSVYHGCLELISQRG